MEHQLIQMLRKVKELSDETKTLYDINEAEMHFLVHIIMDASTIGLSPKLVAKLFKAAAHFIESSEDITKDLIK